jgi:3'-5' exoribonuclease
VESKGFYLNALPSSGEVTLLAALTEKELRPKRSGGVYLHLELADRTGEIDGKAWDRPEEIARTVDCNAVVKIRGTVEAYNDKPQLVVTRIRNCRADEYDPADFYPASRETLTRCTDNFWRTSSWSATAHYATCSGTS